MEGQSSSAIQAVVEASLEGAYSKEPNTPINGAFTNSFFWLGYNDVICEQPLHATHTYTEYI